MLNYAFIYGEENWPVRRDARRLAGQAFRARSAVALRRFLKAVSK